MPQGYRPQPAAPRTGNQSAQYPRRRSQHEPASDRHACQSWSRPASGSASQPSQSPPRAHSHPRARAFNTAIALPFMPLARIFITLLIASAHAMGQTTGIHNTDVQQWLLQFQVKHPGPGWKSDRQSPHRSQCLTTGHVALGSNPTATQPIPQLHSARSVTSDCQPEASECPGSQFRRWSSTIRGPHSRCTRANPGRGTCSCPIASTIAQADLPTVRRHSNWR